MKSRSATTEAALMLALVLLARTAVGSGQLETPVEEIPPPGVEQLMPRGGIPAVFQPDFVAASEAEIPDDAWVLGVAIGGEARAYSLNLLNSHEVVNDRIGEENFAAVW
jgi:hypothetical protein